MAYLEKEPGPANPQSDRLFLFINLTPMHRNKEN